MQFVRPTPFNEAVEKIGEKSVIGSKLKSSEWSEMPLALRDRAFFSATIESVRFLQEAKNFIGDFQTGAKEEVIGPDGIERSGLKAGSRSQFVKEMREFAVASGLGPLNPDDEKTVKDIRSESRLSLIFNTQTQAANDFGYWKQGMDRDLIDEFPAQRFIRDLDVEVKRPLHVQNEGVVRLKTDLDFWLAMNSPLIGGFGTPFGPWGYGSGMGVEDVDREEAEALGLIKPGEKLQPVDKDFNERLQASVRNLDPEMIDRLRESFGSQVHVENGTAKWNPKSLAIPEPASALKREVPIKLPEQATSLDKIVEELGLLKKETIDAMDIRRLREELREANPVNQAQVIRSVVGSDLSGHLKETELRVVVQDFLNFIPSAKAASLPKIDLFLGRIDSLGSYAGSGKVNLNYSYFKSHPEELKRTLFHELMHWFHIEGSAEFKTAIQTHFTERTAGESVKPLAGYGKKTKGKRDKWYDSYAGRVYPGRADAEAGLEVPTRYFELLAKEPAALAELWNSGPEFRETFLIVLKGLF